MKTVHPVKGILHTGPAEARWTIRTLYTAGESGDAELEKSLERMMEKLNHVDDLCRRLRKPDIEVTNKKDKDTGLATIRQLAYDVDDRRLSLSARDSDPSLSATPATTSHPRRRSSRCCRRARPSPPVCPWLRTRLARKAGSISVFATRSFVPPLPLFVSLCVLAALLSPEE